MSEMSPIPRPDRPPAATASVSAPVLVIPQLFDAQLCEGLIARYDAAGGEPSGFMVAENGRTVGRHDLRHKSRRDHLLTAPGLVAAVQKRIVARVLPLIRLAYAFDATRMERYLVACYDAAEGGHFAAHRDTTTPATAHRRFALSVQLNDGFEGGGLSFPEFSECRTHLPAGTGLVFSCSLLHQVDPVRAGRRYVFLPFLYDEAAAEGRRQRQRAEADRAAHPDGLPPLDQ